MVDGFVLTASCYDDYLILFVVDIVDMDINQIVDYQDRYDTL